MRTTCEILIDAPRDQVFARALDIAHWPDVVTAIEKIEILTPGPVAVGTRFRETRKMWGHLASEEMMFAEIDPPHRFLLTAENHGTQYRTEHKFENANGGTRLALNFEGKPVTLFARLMTPLGFLMIGSLKKMIDGDLKDIKRAAEV